MADQIVFYPRALVVMAGVARGEDFSTTISPSSVTITEHPVTHASTAQVTLEGSTLPFRGRQLQALTVAIYAGDVGSNSPDASPIDRNNPKKNLRFVGNVDLRRREEGQRGAHVTLECRDLSGPLRDEKPILSSAIPRYSDTARSALERIIASVPGLSAQLSIRETDELDSPLKKAVGRRAAGAFVALPKTTSTAWDACGIVGDCTGTIVRVELDELVVERPIDAFGEPGQPDTIPVAVTFALGGDNGNLLELSDEQKFLSNRRGLRLVSYDPVARVPIEVLVPEDSALPLRRLPKSVTGKTTRTRNPWPPGTQPERETITGGGITTREGLLAYGKRLYSERLMGETSVHATTPFITEKTMALRSGDLTVLRIRPDIVAELRAQPTEQRRVDFLVQRIGCSPEAARILLKSHDDPNGYHFRVRSATKQFHAVGQNATVSVDLYNVFVLEA